MKGQQHAVAEIYLTVGGGKKREVLKYTFKLEPRILYDSLLGIVM